MNIIALTVEQQKWLKALAEECQAVRGQASALCDGSRPPTVVELAALRQLYQSHSEGLLFRYGQTASYLERSGLSGLRQALEAELQDVAAALAIFQQVEADRRRHQAERWAVQRETEQYVGRVYQEVSLRQQQAFDEHNRRWSAVFNQRWAQPGLCAYCRSPLNLWGYCSWCSWR